MYENIRVSDADRERAAERLREHYAAGRLSADELDERISAALSAKTFGDLRAVLVDLPEPGPIGPEGWPPQGMPAPTPGPAQPPAYYRRGPRLMPIVLVALIAIVLLHGAGFVVAAFFNVILVLFVIAMVSLIAGAARFRRHVRRHWQSGYDGRDHWHHHEWHQ